MIAAEVREDVVPRFGHQHAGIFRICEIDLGDLIREMLAAGIEIAHEALIDDHARLARRLRVSCIDAGDDGKGIMMLSHGGRAHGEQDAIGIDETDLLALTNQWDGCALDNADANAVGQDAHDGGALDPGNLLKLLAAIAEIDEEDVPADVLAEDGKQIGARDLTQAGGFNVGASGDAEAGVALKVSFRGKPAGDTADHDHQYAERK